MIHPKIPTYLTSVFETEFSQEIETQPTGETIQALLNERTIWFVPDSQNSMNQLKDRIERKEVLGQRAIEDLISRIFLLNQSFDNLKRPCQRALPFVDWEELRGEDYASPIWAFAQIPKEDRENVYALARPLLAGLGGSEWGAIIRAVSAIPKELREEVCAEVADRVSSDMKKLSNYAQMHQITKIIRELKQNYVEQ